MKKKKKRRLTSNMIANPGGRGKKGGLIPGTNERVIKDYPQQDVRRVTIPPEVDDFEKTAPEPEDEAAKHKFPPPKKHPTFRKMWMQFIDSVSRRENFSTGHLNNLEILCDLYLEYDLLRAFLRKRGRTYLVEGRQGRMWKPFPEVIMINHVQSQITIYTKLLGLELKKDKDSSGDTEKDSWS